MTSEDFFAFMDGPRIEMSDYSDARGACAPQEVSNMLLPGSWNGKFHGSCWNTALVLHLSSQRLRSSNGNDSIHLLSSRHVLGCFSFLVFSQKDRLFLLGHLHGKDCGVLILFCLLYNAANYF